jgi:hypothetical protein
MLETQLPIINRTLIPQQPLNHMVRTDQGDLGVERIVKMDPINRAKNGEEGSRGS